uniref:Uncharacterized protein n=1 Tax=Rhizophora mucronata TaxID=61149 RepID=A0A2P2PYG1_RHIMU
MDNQIEIKVQVYYQNKELSLGFGATFKWYKFTSVSP